MKFRHPLKCFNCGKLGHISRNCKEKRQIREVTIEEVKEEESKLQNFGVKVSPLATQNHYNVLVSEETQGNTEKEINVEKDKI